ncbi:hypothetical protein B0H14DRAFT_459818 [Mycena olivaceomarginata]|nr:hypothetical protein B0H14DRAFT_459818 [Mycena olivaceomarginata]
MPLRQHRAYFRESGCPHYSIPARFRNPVIQCWLDRPASLVCRLRPLRTHALFPSSRSYSASPSSSLCYPTYPTSSPSARNSLSFYIHLPLPSSGSVLLFTLTLQYSFSFVSHSTLPLPLVLSSSPPPASIPFPSLRRPRLPLRGTRQADFTACGAHGKRLRERRRKWEVRSGGRSGASAGGTQSVLGSRVVVVYCIGASV